MKEVLTSSLSRRTISRMLLSSPGMLTMVGVWRAEERAPAAQKTEDE